MLRQLKKTELIKMIKTLKNTDSDLEVLANLALVFFLNVSTQFMRQSKFCI